MEAVNFSPSISIGRLMRKPMQDKILQAFIAGMLPANDDA